jgi:holo-[acyl-carrier protein] synthase
MKIASGTDIIEINRIKESIESLGEEFCKKIFTENEIKYCESKKNMKYQHYAARFAGKEAIFKAISKILDDKYSISWKDVEIINDENGRPKINFIKNKFEQIQDIDISISHCKQYAVANVTAILN